MNLDQIIAPSSVSAWDIVFAVLTLIVTWIAFRVVRRVTQVAVARIGGLSENMQAVIVRIAKYLVLLLGLGVALTFLGAQLQPLITVVIIVVAVLVIGLRGVAENFGAGMMLQTRKPVRVGDEIESQGYLGVVTGLNGRSVLVETSDGRTVHLPNADVMRNPLANNSERGVRRSEVEVRLVTADLATARQLPGWIANLDGVLAEPAPDALFVTVEPDRVVMRLRFWHSPLVYRRLTSDVVEAVGAETRSRGLSATVTSTQPDPPLTPPAPV